MVWQAIAAAASSVAGSGISAYMQATKEPDYVEATAGQKISAFSARNMADKLSSGTGLSDTAYSRYYDMAEQQARELRASGQETFRGAAIPTAVADRMIKEVFRSASAIEARAAEDVTLKDIEAAMRQNAASIEAEKVAGAREDVIYETNVEKQKQKKAFEENRRLAILNLFLGTSAQVGTAAKSIADEYDERKAQRDAEVAEYDEFYNSMTPEERDKYISQYDENKRNEELNADMERYYNKNKDRQYVGIVDDELYISEGF
jgi:hypothetical protein